MTKENLMKRYRTTEAYCCNCGCKLKSSVDLGSVFVMDYYGNFYCMGCDSIFEDGDERIFEIDLYQ